MHQLFHCESRRVRAMISGDIEQLRQLLDERLIYTHSTGVVDDKHSLLKKIATGELRYRSIESLSRKTIEIDAGAVIYEELAMLVDVRGEPHSIRSRGISMWLTLGNGEWQLLAFQATKI